MYMTEDMKDIDIAEILIGFGCMFTWVSLSRYFENAKQYTFINRTMKVSLPIVGRAMIGMLPFFFGFVFLGLCLFWESQRFNSTSSAMFTLFSMMNGDAISDVYKDLSYWRFIIANLYIYFFVFISIW